MKMPFYHFLKMFASLQSDSSSKSPCAITWIVVQTKGIWNYTGYWIARHIKKTHLKVSVSYGCLGTVWWVLDNCEKLDFRESKNLLAPATAPFSGFRNCWLTIYSWFTKAYLICKLQAFSACPRKPPNPINFKFCLEHL